MVQYESKTEWIPIVTVERTVNMGETSTRTAADISGFSPNDTAAIMRAFLKETEDGSCLQDT